MLTKQQILNARDTVVETVPVPEWAPPGTSLEEAVVNVRSLSGLQRDAFEASLVTGQGRARAPDMRNMRAKLCAQCIVDEQGTQMFTNDEIALLGDKNAKALDRVFSVAQRLSGFTDADVQDLAKNSSAGQLESLPSISA